MSSVSVAPRRLVPWTPSQASCLGSEIVAAKHRLQDLNLFSDDGLIHFLETHPRHSLQAFTMGSDPTRYKEWQSVDTAGISGRDILTAVARGRLWLNIHRVHVFHKEYRDLLDELYADLNSLCPAFRTVNRNATLIISSPTALVYYHVDAQPNLLWHIRGRKRLWLYPAGDRSLIDEELMEDIFASFADEEIPYRTEFDQKSTIFEMGPGDVLSWPQNSPHRVTNLDGLNVSLSTVHETAASDRRKLVYCANRLFRRSYQLPLRSVRESGISAYLKRAGFRAFRRAGMVHTPTRRAYLAKFRIDPKSSGGFSELPDAPVLTEFSSHDFKLERNASGGVVAVELSKPQREK
jgi:hypothetical protein